MHEVGMTRSAFGIVTRKRKCFNDHTFFTREIVCDEDTYRAVERTHDAARRAQQSHANH